MPFEQGGVQGPAQQMIFDGGGLHFGRGRSTTARVEENGKIRLKGKLRAGTSQIGVDLTVSPSCWIITVWQMVLEENSRCLCAAGDENFTIGDISALYSLQTMGGVWHSARSQMNRGVCGSSDQDDD